MTVIQFAKKHKNKNFYVVESAKLIGDTQYRGEFEQKIVDVLKFAKQENLILFFDEIHTLISLGDSDGGIGINNILKPYLTDPKLQFIGATTNNEDKILLQDEAFQRRFTIVKLEKLNLENLEKFLKTILTCLILSYQDLQKMNF